MWRQFYNRFSGQLSGSKALRQAAEQNRIERCFTFPNFERSAERCAQELSRAGLSDVQVERFPADGKHSWSGWRAMTAWDVMSARLWMIEPRSEVLADWTVRPESLVMYSGPSDMEAELIEWNGELDANLSGRIPFTRHRINDVFPQMRRLNVPGIVSDFIGTLSGVRDPFDLPDDARWENSAFVSSPGAYWGFMLTPRQGEMLRRLLQVRPVRVRVEIRTRLYEGAFKSATGVIPGSESTDEILFVTHLYEPGANDNASGAGLALEIARSLNQAVKTGVVPRPRRSIRFLFNWEGYGLYAWMHKHSDRIPHILGGLNIDEIGVDQARGRSVVHLFMPPAANPSCIGHLLAHLCGEILSPRVRWKAVADRAEIINDTITSDPNMDVVLPCLIQYPSRNYHSSADRLDTLSAEVMEAIGMVSATHLHFLADMNADTAGYLARVVTGACRHQLQSAELRLIEGSWPFGSERTRRWFTEQFAMTAASLLKFGLTPHEGDAVRHELQDMVGQWITRVHRAFRAEPSRRARRDDVKRACSMVLRRTTLGTPLAWGSIALSPDEEREYRRILYDNRLDLLFHRICYWADGTRTLLEIVERLEIEMDQLQRDTSIARTSSGMQISKGALPELSLDAVLYVTDRIVRGGYLEPGP